MLYFQDYSSVTAENTEAETMLEVNLESEEITVKQDVKETENVKVECLENHHVSEIETESKQTLDMKTEFISERKIIEKMLKEVEEDVAEVISAGEIKNQLLKVSIFYCVYYIKFLYKIYFIKVCKICF